MKATKKSLLACGVSLLACAAMLVGTTFAWFTDLVSNKSNHIQAGSLQIGAIGYDKDGQNPIDFRDNAPLITQEDWEPGLSETQYIAIYNYGSLPLRYNLTFTVQDEGLEEALWYSLTPVNAMPDTTVVKPERKSMALLAAEGQGVWTSAAVPVGDDKRVALYRLDYGMNESAGNSYQDKGYTANIHIVAMQDNDAAEPLMVGTLEQLQAAANSAAQNPTIILTGNINAPEADVTFHQLVNLDLNGYALTLRTLTIESQQTGTADIGDAKRGGTLSGTDFIVDAPNATFQLYGHYAIDLNVKAVAQHSLHFHGTSTGTITVAAGRVILEETAVLNKLVVPAGAGTVEIINNGTLASAENASGNAVEIQGNQPTEESTGFVSKWDGSVEAIVPEGTVYTVKAAAQLAWIAEQVNAGTNFAGKTIQLDTDIHLADREWTPIGGKDTGKKFQGTFDGCGYTIFNLRITGKNSKVGLFGDLSSGSIKNLRVDTAAISGNTYVGVIAGNQFTASMENCHVTNVQVAGTNWVGGISGHSYGNITRCSSTQGKIEQSPYSFNGGDTGGIVGQFISATMQDCYSTLDITATTARDCGGLIGSVTVDGRAPLVKNCYYSGTLTNCGGGLAGSFRNGTHENAFYNSDTTGKTETETGTPKTTVELQTAATFAQWDPAVWNLTDGQYPTLR